MLGRIVITGLGTAQVNARQIHNFEYVSGFRLGSFARLGPYNSPN